MLADNPLIGFIPTTDATRARAFYVETLKLDFVEDDQFALVVRTHGSMIRIVRMGPFTPAQSTILGWEVPDIADSVRQLTEAGVTFLRYSFLEQNDAGIWTSPSGSHVAWFNDPDGNVLSLSQH
jgi:predicted enzyme related to lactoylglutathione lyase